MITIKIPGMSDIKLTTKEYLELVYSLKRMVEWGIGGMYGDGNDIIDKASFKRANRVLQKLGFPVK